MKPGSPSLKTLQSLCPNEPIDDSDAAHLAVVGGCTCWILDEITMINSDFVSASPSISFV